MGASPCCLGNKSDLAQEEIPIAPRLSLSSNATAATPRVAGHQEAFIKFSTALVCKLTDAPEREMYIRLMQAPAQVRKLVPAYIRDIPLADWNGRAPKEGEVCIEMQDLSADFGGTRASIMDLKVGTRTFLESEVSNPKLREDLLKKMLKVDPNAATAEERAFGITKLRYMQFREQMSTTAKLGFRLEGFKTCLPKDSDICGPDKEEAAKILTEEMFLEHVRTFIQDDAKLKALYLERLRHHLATFAESTFFPNIAIVNCSLLFVHNEERNDCGLWMIDFSKSRPTEKTLTHTKPWELGNEEDGYLKGLTELVRVFERI